MPPTVVAPDAPGSREYTHEPEPSVTATAVVETGTVCIPSTFMKYVGWVTLSVVRIAVHDPLDGVLGGSPVPERLRGASPDAMIQTIRELPSLLKKF